MLDHLPERDRPQVKAEMRRAWRETDYPRALEQLEALAGELDHTYPGAAGSLRKGMQETLTVVRLGVRDKLRRTLESTNPCESMIDTVRRTQRNVKHWSSSEMGLRWTATGMLEAEKQFRKVIGYLDLPRLAVAIERRLHLPQPNPAPTQEAAITVLHGKRVTGHRGRPTRRLGTPSAPPLPLAPPWLAETFAPPSATKSGHGSPSRPPSTA